LHAGHGGEELLGRGGASLNFAQGFVEDLGDIKQTDDVAIFIADRLIISLEAHWRKYGRYLRDA
jgi:hypothetical protein